LPATIFVVVPSKEYTPPLTPAKVDQLPVPGVIVKLFPDAELSVATVPDPSVISQAATKVEITYADEATAELLQFVAPPIALIVSEDTTLIAPEYKVDVPVGGIVGVEPSVV
jgi:hypothetical protein